MDERVVTYTRFLFEMVLEALGHATAYQRKDVAHAEAPLQDTQDTVLVIPANKIDAIVERYQKLFQDLGGKDQLVAELHVTRTETGLYIVAELVLVQEVTKDKRTRESVLLTYIKVEPHHLWIDHRDVPIRGYRKSVPR